MDRSSPGKTPFYRAQWFWLTICTLSSVLFLWFAVAPLLKDPEAVPKIRSAFTQADYRTLPLFLLALFLFYWLKAWRWRLLLKPVGDYRPTTELFPPIMIGFAVNNVLPAHLGEFVRCFVFARQHKIAVTTSVSSVVLERVFDVIAILFYLGLGLLVVDIPDPTIATTAKLFALGATGCVLGGLVYLVWTKPFVNFVEAILLRVPFLPDFLTNKICRMLEGGAEGLAALKDWRLLLGITILSLVKWAINGSLILISVWSFDLNVTIPMAFVLLGVVAIGVTVPSSPGYFGVIQFCFMKVLGLFFDQDEAIFASSIYYHLSQWVTVTAVGFLFLLKTGFSLGQVYEAEEKFEEQLEAPLSHAVEAEC